MINHVRTLLLNRAAVNTYADGTLEEFVDPGFRPIELPTAIATMYTAIMPTSVSRLTANAYVWTYMQLLHRPDFLPHVLAFDSRITYQLDGTEAFDMVRRGEVARPRLTTVALSLTNVQVPDLYNSGDWEGKDELMTCWRMATYSMDKLSAGLLLLARRIDYER